MSNGEEIVRSLTDKVFLGGDLEAIEDLVAPDFVSHDPPPGITPDRDGLRGMAAAVVEAMADRQLVFDEYAHTTDGRVVESWLMEATHQRELFGLPPSGQRVRARGIELWRCEGGLIVEHWGAVDMSDLADKALAGSG